MSEIYLIDPDTHYRDKFYHNKYYGYSPTTRQRLMLDWWIPMFVLIPATENIGQYEHFSGFMGNGVLNKRFAVETLEDAYELCAMLNRCIGEGLTAIDLSEEDDAEPLTLQERLEAYQQRKFIKRIKF